jgi:hypothetical protein
MSELALMRVTSIRLEMVRAEGGELRAVVLHFRWADEPVRVALTLQQLRLICLKARALGIR